MLNLFSISLLNSLVYYLTNSSTSHSVIAFLPIHIILLLCCLHLSVKLIIYDEKENHTHRRENTKCNYYNQY